MMSIKTIQKKIKKQKNNSSPVRIRPVKQPVISHLLELRSRLIWSIGTLLAGSVIGYILRQQILEILVKPLGQPLFYLSPSGGLDFMIKICLFFGILFSLPVFVYHTFRFISPALPGTSTRLISSVFILSVFLMILGILFAYYLSLPAALIFLGKFGNTTVKSLISTDEYLSFIMHYIFGFGLLFQLPIILFIINRIYPLSLKKLIGLERWVILTSFIASAIITPTPDAFNMTFMALPIIFLYQLSVLAIFIKNRGQRNVRNS